MRMEIYQLVNKPAGRTVDKVMIAQVEQAQGGLRITCYDDAIKKKLGEIFTTPIIKRIPTSQRTGVITHQRQVVEPFRGEFYEEVLYELARHGFAGVIRQD